MTSGQVASPNEHTPAPASPRRRRFQFSLASLLWLTTVVACLCAVGTMYRTLKATKAEASAEVQRAEAEVRAIRVEIRRFRDEMGYLDITDPNKVYARRVRTVSGEGWAWRIYVPERPQFQLRAATSLIPAEGFPISECRTWPISHPGTNLVDASVEEPLKGTSWLRVNIVHDIRGMVETKPLASAYSESGSVFESLSTSDAESPLVLLRLRSSKLI
jgi:hypothetical protein